MINTVEKLLHYAQPYHSIIKKTNKRASERASREDNMTKEKTILIEVCRGVVENVYNLPNNYNYEIIENDNYDHIEDVKKKQASEQRG